MIIITAKIYITEDEVIEINRKNLIRLEGSIFDRADLRLPSFGIISNNGSIEFNDTSGKVLEYADKVMLTKGLKCEIYLGNSLAKNVNCLIGTYKTDEWRYDNENHSVSVSIKDDLEEWQDINVAGVTYDPSKPEAKPFSWVFNILYPKTTEKYNMQHYSDADTQTRYVLDNTYLQYPMIEGGSLWAQWTKLCQACQMHIYKSQNGVIMCRYNGGN